MIEEVNNQRCEESKSNINIRDGEEEEAVAAAISHQRSQGCCTRKKKKRAEEGRRGQKRVLSLREEKMEKEVHVMMGGYDTAMYGNW